MLRIFSRDLIMRVLVLLSGVFLISLGIFLFINSQLGSDPITVLVNGLSQTLGITVGQTSFLINSGIILALMVFTGRKFGIGTILHAVFVGVFLDLLFLLLGTITPVLMPLRILMLMTAPLFIGSGIAIYISAGMGEGAIEALMMFLKEKTDFSLKAVKVVMDVVFGVTGVVLGSTFGIGTIIGAFAIGPVAQIAFGFVERIKAHN